MVYFPDLIFWIDLFNISLNDKFFFIHVFLYNLHKKTEPEWASKVWFNQHIRILK